MTKGHYSVWWSEEDGVWLATEIGRLSGTVHGESPEEALREAIEVAEEWDDAGFPNASPTDWDSNSVRQLRHSLAMTQREFADLLNVSLSTVRSWEQGQRIASGPTRRLLDLVREVPGLSRHFQHESGNVAGVA